MRKRWTFEWKFNGSLMDVTFEDGLIVGSNHDAFDEKYKIFNLH